VPSDPVKLHIRHAKISKSMASSSKLERRRTLELTRAEQSIQDEETKE
jgi:hypothetical protein